MEPKGSLLCSQDLATGPYSEASKFSPHFHTILLRYIAILSSHLRLGSLSCLLPQGFQTKIMYPFLISPIRATCPAHLILLDLTHQ